jgi:hypothetical protein
MAQTEPNQPEFAQPAFTLQTSAVTLAVLDGDCQRPRCFPIASGPGRWSRARTAITSTGCSTCCTPRPRRTSGSSPERPSGWPHEAIRSGQPPLRVAGSQ